MPYVISGDGTKIYYEVIGRGEPLVLVQGFSWDLTAWHFQWELGYRFRLVLIDNRGVGLSDKPSGPYSLDSMADDAYAVVSELGFRSIHLLGFSMGGMIAQDFVLRHGDVVKSLILSSTMPHLEITPELRQFTEMAIKLYDNFNMFTGALQVAFSEGWISGNEQVFHELTRLFFNRRMPKEAYVAQLEAMGADLTPRLSEIQVPTTIIHGEADRLIPIENGRKLFNGIPNSRFVVFPDAGHAVYIERPSEYNEQVIRHIELVNSGRFSEHVKREERVTYT
ncbi:alpha/beta fold hydrolase [Vulcanisaeta souniana]|uniref:Lipolytic protein n=1 Tax=Vulcanisaeta souniana JCM 11219 TaxID=1293586 RepID=A0A830EDZ9_9CREN|nr:alpha/beta hydrolase [Vulcanisaeta souniana]BDR91478.1 lipolytic protein [Vulcanisaeta souniana JCM 11219]GGI73450.1 lipolytic protein [Vulcanisaeta souniana JCM 11219]